MTVRRCGREAIGSQCQCTRKCTLYSTLRACHRPLGSKFKVRNGEFHVAHLHNIKQKGQKGALDQTDAFQEQTSSTQPKPAKMKGKRGCRFPRRQRYPPVARSSGSGDTESSGVENSHSPDRSSQDISCTARDAGKCWDARRRDPRVNGADIYVARITKNGMGGAKPCWRCLEWCKWAGVKRIFHWNSEEGRFDVVKVNNAEKDQYETHADGRLYAGLGW